MLAGADDFVEEVRDFIGGQHANAIAEAFEEVDIEADYNRHAQQLRKAIEFVINRRDKSIHDRIVAMHKLFQVRGQITLPTDLGWK
jgi:hypothetical protein